MNKFIIALLAFIGFQIQASNIQLGLEFSNLTPMKGQHYEGWNIVNGQALSTGRFNLNSNGDVYQVNAMGHFIKKIGSNGHANFSVTSNHLKSTTFVLTIEPNNDRNPEPSKVHLFGGDYNSKRTAELAISHGSSLNTDFSDSKGGFMLAAPTGGNFNQGVWFLNPSNGQPSLTLPSLPEGWVYEGWIVNTKNGLKFSTGIFNSNDKVDSDAAGPLAGPLKLSIPNVPGQDIVRSSVVLDDGIHSIVITVEPYPDYDSNPSSVKILESGIYNGAPAMTLMPLRNINEFPNGKVHLH